MVWLNRVGWNPSFLQDAIKRGSLQYKVVRNQEVFIAFKYGSN